MAPPYPSGSYVARRFLSRATRLGAPRRKRGKGLLIPWPEKNHPEALPTERVWSYILLGFIFICLVFFPGAASGFPVIKLIWKVTRETSIPILPLVLGHVAPSFCENPDFSPSGSFLVWGLQIELHVLRWRISGFPQFFKVLTECDIFYHCSPFSGWGWCRGGR